MDKSSTNIFSLLSEQDDIRLLRLHPGNLGDPIKCDIQTESLSSCPKFEAVSYVWGSPNFVYTIELSGTPKHITASLHKALNRLRYSDRARTLWIDQLCINQENYQEKGTQVQLMRKIYQSCSQCIIWFGEITDCAGISSMDAQRALDYFHTMAIADSPPDPEVPVALATTNEGVGARKAIAAMMTYKNPWWTRIWTVQEAVLPRKATIVWGELEIAWSVLENAANNSTNGAIPYSFWTAVETINKIETDFIDLINRWTSLVRGLIITRDGESRLSVIRRWQDRDASDCRDKVYGLAGLFRSGDLTSSPERFYSLSPTQVYTENTITIMQEMHDLQVLVGVRAPGVTPGLPTWASDLNGYEASHKYPNCSFEPMFRYDEFDAAAGILLDCSTDNTNTILSLTGRHIDDIITVGQVIEASTIWEPSHPRLNEVITSWESLVKEKGFDSHDEYVGGGPVRQAFLRTLLGNLVAEAFPERIATGEDLQEADNYLKSGQSNETTYSLRSVVVGQAFFITRLGYIGIGPPSVHTGDEVWILHGGRMPFILRLKEKHHSLIGEAYVHGIMHGEAVRELERPVEKVFII